MRKIVIRFFRPVARGATFLSFTFAIAALFQSAGCAEAGSSGRGAGRSDTELRGVLVLPATNELAGGVVAVLDSRYGTRNPCRLQASDAGVADEIRAFATKGGVVIVTGAPGPEAFLVTAIRADGKPRPKAPDGDTGSEETKEDVWSGITWGSVPAREK